MEPQKDNYWQPDNQPISPNQNAFSQPSKPTQPQPQPVAPAVSQAPVVQEQPAETFTPTSPQPDPTPHANIDVIAEWDASENVHHERGNGWYAVAGVALLILVALAIFFKQWTFVGLLVVMAVTIVVYIRRPPAVLHYSLYEDGLSVNNQHFGYHQFKAFGVRQEDQLYSIVLIPVQRFATAVTMFFDPSEGEKIVDVLGSRLPMRPVEPDWLDKLTRKLRF